MLESLNSYILTHQYRFRGAAPLHYTLLHSRTHTGVTLQTLHPRKLDQGKILLQTPPPGIPIPGPEESQVEDLIHLLAPIGASLLLKGIREEVYLPSNHPPKGTFPSLDDERNKSLRMYPWAPKITPDDRHVDWRTWTADVIQRRAHVLGPVWSVGSTLPAPSSYSYQSVSSSASQMKPNENPLVGFSSTDKVRPFKRFQMRSLAVVPSYDPSTVGVRMLEAGWAFLQTIRETNPIANTNENDEEESEEANPPQLELETNEEEDVQEVLRIWTHDKKLLQIGEIKIEGGNWEDAARAVRRAKMVDVSSEPVLASVAAAEMRKRGWGNRRLWFGIDEEEGDQPGLTSGVDGVSSNSTSSGDGDGDGRGGGDDHVGSANGGGEGVMNGSKGDKNDPQGEGERQSSPPPEWIVPFLDPLQ